MINEQVIRQKNVRTFDQQTSKKKDNTEPEDVGSNTIAKNVATYGRFQSLKLS